MDRRGRGDSGDHPEYEIEKEFSDLAGLIDSIGEPVDVVGHSFGALCALEASLLTRNVRRIVAYEPPLPGALPYWPEALRNEMLPLLAVGKNEEALCSFLSILMSVAPEDIAQMRALPAWPRRVALANTIPRELEALVNVKFDMSRLRNVTCPTTFLVGGASPQFQMEIASAYKSALRKAEVRILEGQGHLAVRPPRGARGPRPRGCRNPTQPRLSASLQGEATPNMALQPTRYGVAPLSLIFNNTCYIPKLMAPPKML